MASDLPPVATYTLNEFLMDVDFSKFAHIIVEGESDKRLVLDWAKREGLSSVVTVTCVNMITFPDSSLSKWGQNFGNRGKVVTACREANARKVDMRGIADKDVGQGVADHPIPELIWTDFPAIESYCLNPSVLDTINESLFGDRLPKGEDLIQMLKRPLACLFLARVVNPGLKTPAYSAGFDGSKSLRTFDASKSLRGEPFDSEEVEQLTNSDIDVRHYSYGHDIAELIINSYRKELKNAGFSRAIAIEKALLMIVSEYGDFMRSELVASLRLWLTHDYTKVTLDEIPKPFAECAQA